MKGICKNCDYEWTTRVLRPKRCPRCGGWLEPWVEEQEIEDEQERELDVTELEEELDAEEDVSQSEE